MKLLIIAQAVDSEDPVLGFFVRWIDELAKHTESVEVICLKSGEFNFPENVRVHSLGKEHAAENTSIYGSIFRRARYVWRFLSLVWRLHRDYDAVFVHMNQEYILLAGWFWRLLGKRVYLWRNHYAGSWRTDIAASFCTKVFCTSKSSYTAKYAKTVLMPVGVDTERFTFDGRIPRVPHSVLFLSRMSPSKRPDMLIDALALLSRDGIRLSASFVGSPLPKDEAFYARLKEKVRTLGLADAISFLPEVSNTQTPDLYRAHETFVNTSPSGMFDKTLFEAAASGCIVLATSSDWAVQAGEAFSCSDASTLAERLAALSVLPPGEVAAQAGMLERVVQANALSRLGEALEKAMR